MKIVLIVEGETERVFLPHLRNYLQTRLGNSMPSLRAHKFDGRIAKGDKLRRIVESLLNDGSRSADHVIALTDVYTGSNPPDFTDARDAISKMRNWVGDEGRFHPHAAQHDFESWLLPYWSTIQQLAGHNKNAPTGSPESVNHSKPPAYHIREIFKIGTKGKAYVKTRDALKILKDNDLSHAISTCPQLKELVNTILEISGSKKIP